MNGIQSSQFFCEKFGFREIYPLNSALADYFEELFDETLSTRTMNLPEPEYFNKNEYSPWSTAQSFTGAAAPTLKDFPESSICVPQLPMKEKKFHTVECAFCKNNGEVANFYRSHRLKDRDGRVICPVLRMYTCPICHTQGGDRAHTIKYCPMNRSSEIVSTISTLSTLRMSNGRKRK